MLAAVPSAITQFVRTDKPGKHLVWFAGGLVSMFAISNLTVRIFGFLPKADPPVHFRGESVLEGLFRWDGGWYYSIAHNGYSYQPGQQSNVAYFPLYPLLMRALGVLTSDVVLAGIFITAVASGLAIVLFGRWCDRAGLSRTATSLAVASLLLYPYAWYLYGVVYSDAVFLLAAVAAFSLLQAGHPVMAGVLGAAATADRPTGIAVALGLCVAELERTGALSFVATGRSTLQQRFRVPTTFSARRLQPRSLGVLISGGGLAAFCTYLWWRFGDALLFAHIQSAWGQGAGLSTLFKTQFFWEVTHFIHRSLTLTLMAQAALVSAALIATPFVGRRFGWGYAVFCITLIALPLVGSKDFLGSGRYLIALFPLHALLGEALERRSLAVRCCWLTTSGILLCGLAAGFSYGWYLA
jgi:hypothetical protein